MIVSPRPLPFGSILGLANVSFGISLGLGSLFYFLDPDTRFPDLWAQGTMTLTTASFILYNRNYYDWLTERWRLPFPRTTAAVLFMTTWLVIISARFALQKAYGGR